MIKEIQKESKKLVRFLKETQLSDGSWNFSYESGIMPDAYMIILLKSLEKDKPILIKQLAKRIFNKQQANGAWKLYHDEYEGNLSTTVEAYYSLLYSGIISKNHPRMKKAERFIKKKGGLKHTGAMTKVMLALTGQYQWPKHLKIPLEIILLPQKFPINFYDLVGYTRVHFVPVMISANKRFSIKTKNTPDITSLFLNKSNTFEELNTHLNAFEAVKEKYKHHKYLTMKAAEKFMLNRIEKGNGTLYSYFSSTFLMIYSLLALGYRKDHPIINKAIQGLISFTYRGKKTVHVQNTTSTIWNTALISYALQESGLKPNDQVIKKANKFLLTKQQKKYGDWSIHNPKVPPGGWGFSRTNTINPDIDDTTAALRAIHSATKNNKRYKSAWNRGVHWTLSMQNNDGGWPAFEKNTDKKILTNIPIAEAKSVAIDPSSSDLTGRTLEFLGNYTNISSKHPMILNAEKWLYSNQEPDGSWYGRWGISYIYGTWASITGLKAVNVSSNHPAIRKGINWLLRIQNKDGGWGESCKSDIQKKYIPLRASTPSQTAWALDTLISTYDRPNQSINRGMRRLIKLLNTNDWRTSYPTGAGLPGEFYTYYHSYNYIWPLLAFSHYLKKYS